MSQATVNKPFLFRINHLWNYSGYLAFGLVALFFSGSTSSFLTVPNIVNILVQASSLGIVACGITVILLAGGNDVIRGGMDLSLAHNLAICVAVLALLLSSDVGVVLAVFLTGAIGVLIGGLNALLTVTFKIIPLLATLAVMYLLQGSELLLTNNTVVTASSPFLQFMATGSLLFIPIPILLFALVAGVMYVIYHQTTYGNWVYAIGGNEEAAKQAGIPVNWIIASTYIVAGFLAVLAAFLVIGRLGGSAPNIGNLMMLDVILAGLLSTIFSRHATPNIQGAVISAIFVTMLTNGFTLLHIPSYWIYAIKGVLILLAVTITTFRQQGRENT